MKSRVENISHLTDKRSVAISVTKDDNTICSLDAGHWVVISRARAKAYKNLTFMPVIDIEDDAEILGAEGLI